MSLWTEDFTNLIVRRYLRGEGPSELAGAFGLTRNQVLSKMVRMGHARRKAPSPPRPARSLIVAQAAAKKVPRKPGSGFLPAYGGPAQASPPQKAMDAIRANAEARANPPPQITLSTAWRPIAGMEPVPFISRSGHQCRWPVGGEGADMLCCGDRALENYCLAHEQLSRPIAGTRDNLDRRIGIPRRLGT